MTPFEIIILAVIYLICYGFMLAMFKEEENKGLRLMFAIVSLVLAVYAPIIMGSMLYEKLKN